MKTLIGIILIFILLAALSSCLPKGKKVQSHRLKIGKAEIELSDNWMEKKESNSSDEILTGKIVSTGCEIYYEYGNQSMEFPSGDSLRRFQIEIDTLSTFIRTMMTLKGSDETLMLLKLEDLNPSLDFSETRVVRELNMVSSNFGANRQEEIKAIFRSARF